MRATRFLRLLQPCRPKPALDQLRRLYPDLLEAQRVLSWLEQSCGTTPNQDSCLEAKVTAHVERSEPLAYLIGSQPFGTRGLDLRMRQPILIARPETEEWATRIAQHLNTFASHQHQPLRILDIGTGSGCIPLLLSSEVDKSGVDLSFVGIDCSAKAIDLAHENKLLHGSLLRHPVDFMQADLFNDQRMGTLGKFDIILSNPPYISSLDYATLDASVREWEDVAALVPFTTWNTSDGLECYRRIVHLLPTLLRSDARPGMMRVGLEIGHLQAEAVVRLLELHAVGQVQKTEVWKDAFGQDRVVAGWSKSV